MMEHHLDDIKKKILETVKSPVLTHEQKVSAMANLSDSLLDVIEKPEGLEELMEVPIDRKCICDLNEGHAPMRPRYIIPDYGKLFKEGSEYLRLAPPRDLLEALNTLLIFYRHVPSVTNFPVYLGSLDTLLEEFVIKERPEDARRLLKAFLINVDRTVLDSFSHADIGPFDTMTGRLLMDISAEIETAVPNLTMKYQEGKTSDDFLLEGIKASLKTAKPSFANHQMFTSELGENYVIASCYNGLIEGGGSYTLSRLILGNIAKKAENEEDFFKKWLPYVSGVMAQYMDRRIKFEVEESGFFENNFLSKEGFIRRDRFTAMFGLVGLSECVNILMEKSGKSGRYGHSNEADDLGVRVMEAIKDFNESHFNPYCEATHGHFLLHAQVGIDSDKGISPGTRIPIGEEPEELTDHLRHIARYHKYFPSGTGDIFPIEKTIDRNPEFLLDIIKGAFRIGARYLSFYSSDSDVIRITGYLVKKSEILKLERGENVIHDTTALGMGAKNNSHIFERKIR